jgi:hypothetical protein
MGTNLWHTSRSHCIVTTTVTTTITMSSRPHKTEKSHKPVHPDDFSSDTEEEEEDEEEEEETDKLASGKKRKAEPQVTGRVFRQRRFLEVKLDGPMDEDTPVTSLVHPYEMALYSNIMKTNFASSTIPMLRGAQRRDPNTVQSLLCRSNEVKQVMGVVLDHFASMNFCVTRERRETTFSETGRKAVESIAHEYHDVVQHDVLDALQIITKQGLDDTSILDSLLHKVALSHASGPRKDMLAYEKHVVLPMLQIINHYNDGHGAADEVRRQLETRCDMTGGPLLAVTLGEWQQRVQGEDEKSRHTHIASHHSHASQRAKKEPMDQSSEKDQVKLWPLLVMVSVLSDHQVSPWYTGHLQSTRSLRLLEQEREKDRHERDITDLHKPMTMMDRSAFRKLLCGEFAYIVNMMHQMIQRTQGDETWSDLASHMLKRHGLRKLVDEFFVHISQEAMQGVYDDEASWYNHAVEAIYKDSDKPDVIFWGSFSEDRGDSRILYEMTGDRAGRLVNFFKFVGLNKRRATVRRLAATIHKHMDAIRRGLEFVQGTASMFANAFARIVGAPDNKDGGDCIICLGRFRTGNEEGGIRGFFRWLRRKTISITDCGHVFHTKCIQSWIHIAQSCPVCRRENPVLFSMQGADMLDVADEASRVSDEDNFVQNACWTKQKRNALSAQLHKAIRSKNEEQKLAAVISTEVPIAKQDLAAAKESLQARLLAYANEATQLAEEDKSLQDRIMAMISSSRHPARDRARVVTQNISRLAIHNAVTTQELTPYTRSERIHSVKTHQDMLRAYATYHFVALLCTAMRTGDYPMAVSFLQILRFDPTLEDVLRETFCSDSKTRLLDLRTVFKECILLALSAGHVGILDWWHFGGGMEQLALFLARLGNSFMHALRGLAVTGEDIKTHFPRQALARMKVLRWALHKTVGSLSVTTATGSRMAMERNPLLDTEWLWRYAVMLWVELEAEKGSAASEHKDKKRMAQIAQEQAGICIMCRWIIQHHAVLPHPYLPVYRAAYTTDITTLPTGERKVAFVVTSKQDTIMRPNEKIVLFKRFMHDHKDIQPGALYVEYELTAGVEITSDLSEIVMSNVVQDGKQVRAYHASSEERAEADPRVQAKQRKVREARQTLDVATRSFVSKYGTSNDLAKITHREEQGHSDTFYEAFLVHMDAMDLNTRERWHSVLDEDPQMHEAYVRLEHAQADVDRVYKGVLGEYIAAYTAEVLEGANVVRIEEPPLAKGGEQEEPADGIELGPQDDDVPPERSEEKEDSDDDFVVD